MEYLDEEIGDGVSVSDQYAYACPFCSDYKRRLYVNQESGLWKCHNCDESGNAVSMVMKLQGITAREAAEVLEYYGIDDLWMPEEIRNQDLTIQEKLLLYLTMEEEKKENPQLDPPPMPNNIYRLSNFLEDPPEIFFPFLRYLAGRGLTISDIINYDIGCIVEDTIKTPNGRGMRVKDHLFFPNFSLDGILQYWNTRSIYKEAKPKSINAPNTDTQLGSSDVVFNLNQAIHTDKIVVTEAVFDAITVGKSGVATYGKSISDSQIEQLMETNLPIYLFLDTDAYAYMQKTADKIQSIKEDYPLYYVINPHIGEDANTLGKQVCKELVEEAVPVDARSNLMLDLM